MRKSSSVFANESEPNSVEMQCPSSDAGHQIDAPLVASIRALAPATPFQVHSLASARR